ncbi:MAG TPA: asparagine synthase (glutamine-hydrolyzing), partial [Gemmatimonadaceae bacterium]|nr:asparagine synthase (glutamine-hydrolyzing) [Gemmatimonadaceae bacterium]
MCGIAGILASNTARPADVLHELACRMGDAIAHRGPDDHGAWIDAPAGVALAHRRLSVIDLSFEGHQPMASLSGRYVIVYNGEIYNYSEVRGQIEAANGERRWRGHSDTEVMLAAFEQWGLDDALARFNGMFAFGLWDRRDRTLHVARDRLGEKPLYYGVIGDAFAFASELKALRTLSAFANEVDRDALALFLRFNFVPAPWSIYRGISKLLPGTRAEIRTQSDGRFAVRHVAYWDVATVARNGLIHPAAHDATVAIDRLQAALERAVRLRMVADVPVGAFLSGGIDSSVVTAAMQRQSSKSVRTFTMGFAEAAFDEAPFARQVATHLGTDHTELYVTGEAARSVVPLLPTMYDEPFADSSQIPTYLMSRLARAQVTVALSGDGGDELFCGYERYVRNMQIECAPSLLRRAAAAALRKLSPGTVELVARGLQPVVPRALRFAHPGEKMHKLVAALDHANPRERYLEVVSFWAGGAPIHGNRPVTSPHDRFAREDRELPLGAWMMLLDQRTYLPDDILVKVDRASMAVALEARVPLLDHDLLAYAWSLPLSLKIKHGRGKYLLRELLCRYVPRELVERPKRGFTVPLGAWLRGPL